jgi:hypothetical protein
LLVKSWAKWTVVTALLLAGCEAPVPPGMPESEWGALRRSAAMNLHCEQEALVYESLPEGRHLFRGCKRELEVMVLDEEHAKGGQHTVAPSPANLFARVTGCKLRETRVLRGDDGSFSVAGCGRKTTYVQQCEVTCKWTATAEMTLTEP